METSYFVLLAVAAFLLAACPFSLWIGKWLLGKDIRNYGDRNPGAFNVFRAGGRKAGVLALVVDIAKAMPFVVLAYYYFAFPETAVMAVGLCAILGHAYSPILRFKGGKALAVICGVMLALPQHEIVISVLLFIFVGLLFIEIDAWRVMVGLVASMVYLMIIKGSSWEVLFVLCLAAIVALKHFDELKTMPKFKGKLITWLQARKTAHLGRH